MSSTVIVLGSGALRAIARPSDDLILSAIGLSGVPAFNELIDAEAIDSMADPLKLSIEKLLN